MNHLATVMLAVALLGMGYLLGATQGYLHMMYRGAKGWKNLGKKLILILPEIPGAKASFEWTAGDFIDKPSTEPSAERDDMDRILPAGPATYPTNWGPLNIVSNFGHNLVAPSKLEAAETLEKTFVAEWVRDYQRQPKKEEAEKGGAFAKGLSEAIEKGKQLATRLQIWDPLTYYKACRENDMQDLYNSNGGQKDPWYAKAAFIGVLIVGFLLLAVLGVIMMKVLPALANHGA